MPDRTYGFQERADDGATADFFVLDTTPLAYSSREEGDAVAPTPVADQQIAWLDKALAGSRADWKLVIGHHPVFSGGHHGDTPELVRVLAPVLQRHGVSAYFNGHDHDLQHIEVGGVRYLTTGSGSRSRPTAKRAGTLFCSDRPGFLSMQIDRKRLQLAFWD